MHEPHGTIIERVLKKRDQLLEQPTWAEMAVIQALGTGYLQALDDPDMLDIALGDLEAIKEMRPDLGDLDLAYLVRTADDDEDATAWMERVERYRALSMTWWQLPRIGHGRRVSSQTTARERGSHRRAGRPFNTLGRTAAGRIERL